MPVKVLDIFGSEVNLDASANEPEYASAGDGKYYTWAGRKYPRVTSILAVAPGEHLMAYHAKVAALRAAAPLIHAGLLVPTSQPSARYLEFDALDEWDDVPNMDAAAALDTMAQLERYVDCEAMKMLSQEEAIAMACDWRSNMNEPFRYRDHKGRIGHVAHWAKADIAMGLRTSEPNVEYLASLTAAKMVWPEEVVQRYEDLGKTVDDMTLDLAHHALPHALNVWEFVQLYRPEYEMIGVEAVVINRDEEYAGTLDEIAIYRKDIWQDQNQGKWPFDHGVRRARLIGDLKTSNHLANSVRFQLAAYAKASFIGVMQDQTEHAMPEFDGMIALHSKPEEGMVVKTWGAHCIDPCFECFRGLNSYYRGLSNLPRSSRGRIDKPAPRGQRDCPIFVGGGK